MFRAADQNGSAGGQSHLGIQEFRAFAYDPNPVLGQSLLLLDQHDFESHPAFVRGRDIDRLIRGKAEGIVSEESIRGKIKKGSQLAGEIFEGGINGRPLA